MRTGSRKGRRRRGDDDSDFDDDDDSDVDDDVDYDHDFIVGRVVWTKLPGITLCCPCIGHMGIEELYPSHRGEGGGGRGKTSTSGWPVVHDFAGNYFVNKGRLTFGKPLMALDVWASQVTGQEEESLDEDHESEGVVSVFGRGVREADEEFGSKVHHIAWQNCHTHVGVALGSMGYLGRGVGGWGTIAVWAHLMRRGKYISTPACLGVWLPGLFLWTCCIGILVLIILLSSR